ncbi:MAG: hypothetical protein ACRDPC_07585 [Solirubrobacteraceae bacterium]
MLGLTEAASEGTDVVRGVSCGHVRRMRVETEDAVHTVELRTQKTNDIEAGLLIAAVVCQVIAVLLVALAVIDLL